MPIKKEDINYMIVYPLFIFFQMPQSEEEWLKVAKDFEEKWNYPCCVGAIDGKHIAVKQPENTGSEFFNYKHYFSVLLLAVCDANYRFIYVDVGASGRAGDAGVFNDSSLNSALVNNSLNLPPPRSLPGITESKIQYHLVGDDAFCQTLTMMKPYPHRNLDAGKRVYNYRLSRARRVVENSFGILANRFRIFLTTINLQPDKVTNLILATCCLHNYMVDKNKHAYTSVQDIEHPESHTVSPGPWRNDVPLLGMGASVHRNPTRNAKMQRELLTKYFSSDFGSVSWQNHMAGLE